MDPISPQDKQISSHIEDAMKDEMRYALTPIKARRLLLKIDLRVLPMLAVVYAVSVIDKVNIGSAKVLGMTEDLDLNTGSRYSIILLLFFPAYALSDIPSNLLLVRLSPRYWLSFLIIGWGAVMIGMGFTTNWRVMAFLRFLLGGFEGGVFPAMVYIISSWYGRFEIHRRLSMCYSLAIISSAAAAFLSYALGLLGGDRGMSGWRWIFSIEGAASMLFGILGVFLLPTFPDQAKWLSPDEKQHLRLKLLEDRGDFVTEKITINSIIECGKDWTLWLMAIVFCFNTSSSYALSFFSPSILTSLGYSGLKASLYSAYPYLATLGLLLVGSYFSDKLHLRSPVIILQSIIQIAGYIIIRPNYSARIRYLGIFLATMGTSCNTIAILTFSQSNTIGSAHRGVASAAVIGFGVTGGIIGSTIFRAEDAPAYGPGIYTTIGMISFNVIAISILAWVYYLRNKRADREGTSVRTVATYRYSY